MAKSPKKGIIAGACVALGVTAIIATTKVNFNAQMEKAREYISNAEYSKAVEILDEHKGKNGTQEDVYLLYADYYIAQEEYQSAVDVLEEGAGKAQYTDKINAKIDEINHLYESELNQEPKKPPVESSDSTESTTTSENPATSEVESSAPSVPESTQPESSSTATAPPQSSSTTTPSTPQYKPSVVYIAASGSGSKYHRSSRCSGMNGNVIEMTREEAEAAGYSPCKKSSCYG